MEIVVDYSSVKKTGKNKTDDWMGRMNALHHHNFIILPTLINTYVEQREGGKLLELQQLHKRRNDLLTVQI